MYFIKKDKYLSQPFNQYLRGGTCDNLPGVLIILLMGPKQNLCYLNNHVSKQKCIDYIEKWEWKNVDYVDMKLLYPNKNV